MTSERDIQAAIWAAMSPWSVMFRNNVGAFRTLSGALVRFGLTPGSSDLIGWTPVVITEDMVGDTVAVFTAVECKTVKGKPTDKQKLFICRVQADGGYAGVARSVEDAMGIIERG